MSIKNWVQNLFGKKLVVKEDPKDSRDDYLHSILDKNVSSLLMKIRHYSESRESELRDFKEMLTDGVTNSAVELIAEDASLLDPDTDQVAWVVCVEDSAFAEKMTEFLKTNLDVSNLAYTLAYHIIAYGECYLNTNYSNDEYRENFEVGDFFTVEDPMRIMHLYKFGVPLGFMVRSSTDTDYILPERSYIHFVADRGGKEYLSEDESDGVYAKYGTSFLESARRYYKQRQLLDDLLVLSRLTRSTHYRIFNTEIGGASSADTHRIMGEVRNAVNSKENFSVMGDVFSSRSAPILNGGNIFTQTRNGIGAISVEEVGGEVNVSSLADIDYFDDRYYGALKVPKQFLGQAKDMPGGIGDTTLTQLDIRYARTVKRVQRIIKSGLQRLIIWKCDLDDILPPDFEVRMTPIITAEDDKRSQLHKDELERVKGVIDLLRDLDETLITNADKSKLAYFILTKVYKNADMLGALNIDMGSIEEESSGVPEEGEPEEEIQDDEDLENNTDYTTIPSSDGPW